MKKLTAFLNEAADWKSKAKQYLEASMDQPPRARSLHLWNHFSALIKHHESRLNDIAQTMVKLNASDDDRVQRLGQAELATHRSEIAKNRDLREKHRWALKKPS